MEKYSSPHYPTGTSLSIIFLLLDPQSSCRKQSLTTFPALNLNGKTESQQRIWLTNTSKGFSCYTKSEKAKGEEEPFSARHLHPSIDRLPGHTCNTSLYNSCYPPTHEITVHINQAVSLWLPTGAKVTLLFPQGWDHWHSLPSDRYVSLHIKYYSKPFYLSVL